MPEWNLRDKKLPDDARLLTGAAIFQKKALESIYRRQSCPSAFKTIGQQPHDLRRQPIAQERITFAKLAERPGLMRINRVALRVVAMPVILHGSTRADQPRMSPAMSVSTTRDSRLPSTYETSISPSTIRLNVSAGAPSLKTSWPAAIDSSRAIVARALRLSSRTREKQLKALGMRGESGLPPAGRQVDYWPQCSLRIPRLERSQFLVVRLFPQFSQSFCQRRIALQLGKLLRLLGCQQRKDRGGATTKRLLRLECGAHRGGHNQGIFPITWGEGIKSTFRNQKCAE